MNLIAVSPQYEAEKPGNKQALERTVRRALEAGHGVNSASGMTAALAINYCERLGLSYTVKKVMIRGMHAGYYVELNE